MDRRSDNAAMVRDTIEVKQKAFAEIVALIRTARGRAVAAVNESLVGLYWRIGAYISRKLEEAAWGDGVVDQLARYIQRHQPNAKGFARRNLFRMVQFFEAYRDQTKVSALLTQLPWTHHLLIIGRTKRPEQREFYIRLAVRERWGSRELERQLEAAAFERAVVAPTNVSPVLRPTRPRALELLRDSYLVEFLDLPCRHAEDDTNRR